ncbi:histidinol dehydrogenase [Hyaloraphidium curvatum]|nr:histidinol dehydrogenase [Hyaloraphidium curvatum]
MAVHRLSSLSPSARAALLKRPVMDAREIMPRVEPIIERVRKEGDAAVAAYTERFDGVRVEKEDLVMRPPFRYQITDEARRAIDVAYGNIRAFHAAQLEREGVVEVETMKGLKCSRHPRPIERVGLYVPGGSAVLPSTALMLGVPAQVAGCRTIVLATPPRKDGTVCQEVLYVAEKVGAVAVVKAGGAQAVAAMAYGTETIPKVDKIFGPGNQYVTAAKLYAQNDFSCNVGIDLPAGPSEVLVVADSTAKPSYVASDLLSQVEHGPDSQAVLVALGMPDARVAEILAEVERQAATLPRGDILARSILNSYVVLARDEAEALDFTNDYAPEHLILYYDGAEKALDRIRNAGSVFVGPWAPVSCGDYASGTNHTLPTYGFARTYSGVNTAAFLKHITSQVLTAEGLRNVGPTVMALAEVEDLEAHRQSVAIRLKDIEAGAV